MSSWGKFGLSGEGGDQNDSEVKNSMDVDWFSNDHDIFSGGADTLLVDPREMKRAETAPSVLTMFSADGTLCVSGGLEEVPPEEEYRYTEEYHMLYYSKFPRDPRMLVPLRTRGAAKRNGETGLPGRGVTDAHKSHDETSDATAKILTTANTITKKDNNIISTSITTGETHITAHDADESAQDAKEKGAAFAKSVLESLSREEEQLRQQLNKHEEKYHSPSSSMDVHQLPTNVRVENNSTSTSTVAVCLQPPIDNMLCNNAVMTQLQGQQKQDSIGVHSAQQVGGLSSRRGARGGNRSVQSPSTKNMPRKFTSTGDGSGSKLSRDELTVVRDYIDGARLDCLLEDTRGHIVTLSKDQDGSRFVQRLLDDEPNIEPIFNEVFENMHDVIIDVFGNYVLQKLLDVLPVGSTTSTKLISKVNGRLREYSFQMYGCRVVQKILDRASQEIREEMLLELKDSLIDCIFDQNANHVAQKIIEVMPEKTQFLVEALLARLKTLSRHPYGCRVLQCVFERCSQVPEVNIRPLLMAVLDHVHEYVMDQYGNYVVQHAMLNAPEELRQRFVELLIPHVYALSCSKFASNVAEKTIVKANEEELERIVQTLTHPLGGSEDGNYLVLMMQDPYANYVVQRLLQEVNKEQQKHIAEQTRPHILNIRRSVYGQHLVQKMETMGMFSWVEGGLYNSSLSRDQKNNEVGSNINANNISNNNNNGNIVGRGGGRKNRGGGGVRGGGGGTSRSTPHPNHLTSIDHQLVANNSYHQAATAVAVSGQNMLPLATTTGSRYGYGYVGSPSESLLLQSQQPHLISAPSLAIGGQPCYPSMIPQHHQRHHFTLQGQQDSYTTVSTSATHPHHQHQQQQTMRPATDVYSANGFYSNGKGLVTHGNGDGWAQAYQGYHPSIHPAVFCGNNPPNAYPAVSASFHQPQYNPTAIAPLTMQ